MVDSQRQRPTPRKWNFTEIITQGFNQALCTTYPFTLKFMFLWLMVIEQHALAWWKWGWGPRGHCDPFLWGPGHSKSSLLWCPNMLKPSIYGKYLQLISPQVLYFLIFSENWVQKLKSGLSLLCLLEKGKCFVIASLILFFSTTFLE